MWRAADGEVPSEDCLDYYDGLPCGGLVWVLMTAHLCNKVRVIQSSTCTKIVI